LVVEAAREYAKRIPHRLPSKLVPDAVKEMLEAREKGEGASKTVLMPPRWLRTRWEVKLHPAGRKAPGTSGDSAGSCQNQEPTRFQSKTNQADDDCQL
jgi:hypothetical protein